MSKLSSQDVIDLGNYLEPGFDPKTLTVAYLRAILQNHDVNFPSNAVKAQLIKAFEENIVPNASKYKRIRRDNAAIPSDASDIFDGATGEPLEVCASISMLTLWLNNIFTATNDQKKNLPSIYAGGSEESAERQPNTKSGWFMWRVNDH